MQISLRALTLLLLVAGCLLVSNVLPAVQPLWFVGNSGKLTITPWLEALYMVLLVRQWGSARIVLLLLLGLHATFFLVVLGESLSHGGHVLGYCFVLPLLFLAMGILAYSTALKQFLRPKSTPSVGGLAR
jgi:hypothetical protein